MSSAQENHTEQSPGLQSDLDLLHEIFLFRGLDYDCMKLLALLAKRVQYIAGDRLMVEGEEDDNCYLLVSGAIGVCYHSNEQKVELKDYGAGDFFGGGSLLSRMTRLYTLEAKTGAVVLVISREQFQKVVHQYPNSLERVVKNYFSELTRWDRIHVEALGKEKTVSGVSLL
ncbi:MAG: cyclic nucleotide-binding domain-containing protein [Thermodesulfobacteriota bacterium]